MNLECFQETSCGAATKLEDLVETLVPSLTKVLLLQWLEIYLSLASQGCLSFPIVKPFRNSKV